MKRGGAREPLLRNLLLMQIASLLVGFALVAAAVLSLRHVSTGQLADETRRQAIADLAGKEEQWRAWAQLGLSRPLADDLAQFRAAHPLVTVDVIPRAEAPEPSDRGERFFLPPPETLSSASTWIVRGAVDRAALLTGRFRYQALGLTCAVLGAVFLFVVLVSARYVRGRIYSPLRRLEDGFRALSHGEEFDFAAVPARGEMRGFVDQIGALVRELKRRQRDAAFGEIAQQVAHDIRSPLTVLDVTLGATGDEERALQRQATARIREIADALLAEAHGTVAARLPLAPLLERVLAEKRVEFKDRPDAHFRLEIAEGSAASVVTISGRELTRTLSNLVNNAVEALRNGRGEVTLSLAVEDGDTVVAVSDDGIGIPAPLLAELGERGRTHGKRSGSGLGLHSARQLMERVGGRLELRSAPGRGTTARLCFPRTAT